MCVILAVEKESNRPTRHELDLAWAANPHGAGIAWLEGDEVRFEKVGPSNVDVDRIIGLALSVPVPFIVHFRITSSGQTGAELSHPFPIRVKKPLTVSGSGRAVLFHNGTWREDWQRMMLQAAAATGQRLGNGPVSDTRAMAFLAAVLGRTVFDVLPPEQKLAVLSTAGVRRWGTGWIEHRKGLWMSNGHWLPKPDPKPAGEFTAAVVAMMGPKPKAYLTHADIEAMQAKSGTPRLVKKGGQ